MGGAVATYCRNNPARAAPGITPMLV